MPLPLVCCDLHEHCFSESSAGFDLEQILAITKITYSDQFLRHSFRFLEARSRLVDSTVNVAFRSDLNNEAIYGIPLAEISCNSIRCSIFNTFWDCIELILL